MASVVISNINIVELANEFNGTEVVLSELSLDEAFGFINRLTSFLMSIDFKMAVFYECGCFVSCYTGADFEGRTFEDVCAEIADVLTQYNCVVSVPSANTSYAEIHVEYLSECENCAALREKLEKMRPDSLLQQAVYSHGLATGFGANLVTSEVAEANLKKLTSLRGKEICCAWKSQQIGGFGCFVQGEVTVASNKDLWSFVARDGSRKFNINENMEYLIDRKEDIDFSVCDHTEFFVIPDKIVGFWAKEWFVRSVAGGRELVEKLRKEGYKVWITAARHK